MLLKKKLTLHPALLIAVAFAASVQIMSYASSSESEELELTGPTVEEMKSYLNEKHALEADLLDDSGDQVRIRNFDPASAAGKIVIKVHKSVSSDRAEFMEVFRQRSADPTDLDPILVFDGGATNQTLVSTAGTYGAKTYVTPSGVFAIDSLEAMHYSSAYNNAPMPFTMFFNQGIAIHAATPSEFKHLGRKASHGCVRVHPTQAKQLFDLIRNEGRSSAVVQILDN